MGQFTKNANYENVFEFSDGTQIPAEMIGETMRPGYGPTADHILYGVDMDGWEIGRKLGYGERLTAELIQECRELVEAKHEDLKGWVNA